MNGLISGPKKHIERDCSVMVCPAYSKSALFVFYTNCDMNRAAVKWFWFIAFKAFYTVGFIFVNQLIMLQSMVHCKVPRGNGDFSKMLQPKNCDSGALVETRWHHDPSLHDKQSPE